MPSQQDDGLLDGARITLRDHDYTNCYDDEQVEGGAANDRRWPELPGVEIVANDLNDRKLTSVW
eukprot:CAMPEP_0115065880 /NCGR_PEP_ID=MMETSP0227-20121206/10502_1 /TAXON_ID=89957 /ORGANISM="Polarella glacialis, Strain CCMP 1383" /LENGTH=63 /DNA_ID=CAMNT_0002451729 /DNA_START=379 /DNA_END=568 /DNA_ORIENTATION=+